MTETSTLADAGREVIRLTREKRRLSAESAEIAEKLRSEWDRMLELFRREGVGETRVDGTLVKIQRSIYVGAAGEECALAEALKAAGLGEFVSEAVDTRNLAGWVKEQPEGPDGMPIVPEELRDKLKVAEMFKVVAYPK